jgi:hypothetical protein
MEHIALPNGEAYFPPMTHVSVIRENWEDRRSRDYNADGSLVDQQLREPTGTFSSQSLRDLHRKSMEDSLVMPKPIMSSRMTLKPFPPTQTHPLILTANHPPNFADYSNKIVYPGPLRYGIAHSSSSDKIRNEVIYRGPTDEPGHPFASLPLTPDIIQVLNHALTDHRDTVVLAHLTQNPENYSALNIYRVTDLTLSNIFVVGKNGEEWVAEIDNRLAQILPQI